MYIARPLITPSHCDQQLVKKNTQSQKQQATVPAPVVDRDNSLRDPVTKQFLSRFQNQQSVAADLPVKINNGG